MSGHPFFLLGLVLLLTHEMAAVRRREWKMFPFLSGLDEKTGYVVFTALHVPLYLLLFWGLFGASGEVNRGLVLVLDAFFVIHVFLHLLRFRHPDNQFKNGFSWGLIIGAGICGALDLGSKLP